MAQKVLKIRKTLLIMIMINILRPKNLITQLQGLLQDQHKQNKTKHLLVENEFKKLQQSDLIYFRGKSHFEEDGTQNYLVFPPMYRYIKRVINSDYILRQKSKGLSDESIKSPSAPHNFLNPS